MPTVGGFQPAHSVHLGNAARSAVMTAAMRGWRLVLAFGLVGAVGAIALCQVLPTRYASSVTLMLNPVGQERGGPQITPSSLLPPSEEMVRKNAMSVIRSRELAERVIASLDLEQDPEFNPTLRKSSAAGIAIHHIKELLKQSLMHVAPPAKLDAAAERAIVVDTFLGRLDVTSTDASRIVVIRFSASSPSKAARISQAVASETITWTRNQLRADARAAAQSLQAAITAVNLQIRDAERHIETILREHGNLAAADLQVLGQHMSNLSLQIAAADAERATAEARLAELQAARSAGRADSLPAVLSSLLIQRLQEQAAGLSAKAAGQGALYDRKSGRTIELEAALASVRARIDAEVNRIATSYQTEAAVAKAKQSGLLQSLDHLKDQMAEARAAAVDIKMHEREVAANKTVLDTLAARLAIEQGQINSSPSGGEVISNASVPRTPSFPPILPLMAAGAMLSGTAGAGIAFLLERRDNGIRCMAQLRDITDSKVLGAIPATGKSLVTGRAPPERAVLAEPASIFVDSLRALWLRLEFATSRAANRILITSSVAGEGKSALTASLARMLASSGHSVAVIDADFRASKIHSMLGLSRSPGLANVLEGEVPLEQVLQLDEASSACVLSAGTTQRSPVELLSSPGMARVLNDLASQFSFILIDSPPVLAVPDTGVLARVVDTTVVAVRWGSTSSPIFSAAMQHFQDLELRVDGLVLTMVDPVHYWRYDYIVGGTYSDRRAA